MKIQFIQYYSKPQVLQFSIQTSLGEEKNEKRLQELLSNSIVDSMNMILTYNQATQIYTVLKCDSLSALLFNIKKRVLDNGVSQKNWDSFLEVISKTGIKINFGSKQKLDTLLPKDVQVLIADNLTVKEVARLSRVSRFFRDEIKQVKYWKKELIKQIDKKLLNEAIETEVVKDYKNLYLHLRDWSDEKINDLSMLFCKSGDASLVRYAVENKLVTAKSRYWEEEDEQEGSVAMNPFLLTVRSGSVEAVKEIVKIKGVDLTATCGSGLNALYYAGISGSAEMIRLVSEIPGIDVNDCGENGDGNGLHMLLQVGGGSSEAIRVFAEIPGFDVNMLNYDGEHPLILAVKYCSPEAIREVGKLPGLDTNAEDGDGRNALLLAVEDKPLEVIREVAKIPGLDVSKSRTSGLNPHHGDRCILGRNALHVAIANRPLEIIQEVAKIPGIYLGAVDDQRNNILHLAVKYSTPEVVIFLRRLILTNSPKIDLNRRNENGNTPAMLAAGYSEECLKALKVEVQPLEEESSEDESMYEEKSTYDSSSNSSPSDSHTEDSDEESAVSSQGSDEATGSSEEESSDSESEKEDSYDSSAESNSESDEDQAYKKRKREDSPGTYFFKSKTQESNKKQKVAHSVSESKDSEEEMVSMDESSSDEEKIRL